MNTNKTNIKQLFGPETLQGLSRNGPLGLFTAIIIIIIIITIIIIKIMKMIIKMTLIMIMVMEMIVIMMIKPFNSKTLTFFPNTMAPMRQDEDDSSMKFYLS